MLVQACTTIRIHSKAYTIQGYVYTARPVSSIHPLKELGAEPPSTTCDWKQNILLQIQRRDQKGASLKSSSVVVQLYNILKNLQQLKPTLGKKHNYALELQHEASLAHTRDQKTASEKRT